ncbi:MAG: hypothetical protein ACPH45_04975 [Porticoccaceae bacterium]
MNNKTIAQSALLMVIFAVVIWLAADMFLQDSPKTANTASETKVITKHIPAPEKVSSATMQEATRAMQSPEVKLITSEFNEKFYTLREEKLNAAIAQVIAQKLKASSHDYKQHSARQAYSHSPNSVNLTDLIDSDASSAFVNASLTYFDYGQQKAVVRVHNREFSVFIGMVIDDMTIAAFKKNGLLISRNKSQRLLAVPKTYSTPNSSGSKKSAFPASRY